MALAGSRCRTNQKEIIQVILYAAAADLWNSSLENAMSSRSLDGFRWK